MGSHSATWRARSVAAVARMYARGATASRSTASGWFPTSRVASARRCSSVFDACRPTSSGWASAAWIRPSRTARRRRSSSSRSSAAVVRRYSARACSLEPRWAANWSTDSSVRPSKRRDAPSSRPASATRPATDCSGPAPRSSRCTSLRATTTDGPSSPSVASSTRAAINTRSGLVSSATRGSVCRRARRGSRSAASGSMSPSAWRRATAAPRSGSARSSTPLMASSRHDRGPPLSTSFRNCSRAARDQRSAPGGIDESQSSRLAPGRAWAQRRAASKATSRVRLGAGSLTSSMVPSSSRNQPSAGATDALTRPGWRRSRSFSRRRRSAGGVASVVTSTTRRRAA